MPPKVVLITGASGYLGQHLLVALSPRKDLILHGTTSTLSTFCEDFADMCTCHSVDLADSLAVSSLMRDVRPDVIVHAAAISSPRVCEADPARAMAVNAPEALLHHLKPHAAVGCALVPYWVYITYRMYMYRYVSST